MMRRDVRPTKDAGVEAVAILAGLARSDAGANILRRWCVPLVMTGSFDLSRASPFRRDGDYGWSVRLPVAAPSDARQPPLRSATFARPS